VLRITKSKRRVSVKPGYTKGEKKVRDGNYFAWQNSIISFFTNKTLTHIAAFT
jgi:hypothetical protein